jgi:uncharacterized SAM-binding protein YcdF (DUF218 family)
MFFYLSQFLSFLAMPLTLVLLFLAFGFWKRKKALGRKSILLGILLLYLFSNQFLANSVMRWWESEVVDFRDLEHHEVGIILTGVTNINKSSGERTFFARGADRVTHTLQLYRLGKIDKILITGGLGLDPSQDTPEAQLLKNVLLLAEVPEDSILLEPLAKNTRENALFSKQLLDAEGFTSQQKHLLITSASHMTRAKACFDKVGLQTSIFPVDYYAEDLRFNIPVLFFPDPQAMLMWHKLFKEWIGIAMYKVAGYI